MREALSRRVDPWQAAARQLHMEGEIRSGSLARVSGQAEPLQPLRVRMDFMQPGYGVAQQPSTIRVRTRVSGRFTGTCRRCLEPVEFPLTVDAEVEVVGHESNTAGREAGERMVVAPGDALDVFALVEDEVLLALPFAPAHAPGECGPMPAPTTGPVPGAGSEVEEVAPARENPFAVLSRLKPGAEDC